MILIHQSRCSVCPPGLSVCLLNDCLSERVRLRQERHPQHYFLISQPQFSLACFSIWCRNEFFWNIRPVWLRPWCPGNGLISWQTVGNVFRISGQISRLYSTSVTFEFPAATGNHIRTGQYQYSCLYHRHNNIIDEQYQTDITTESALQIQFSPTVWWVFYKNNNSNSP